MIGRIPILDVEPVLPADGLPARAVAGETFQVTATVFREGHEMLGAAVVLTDPAGKDSPLLPMRELAPGTDRYGADVTVGREGLWEFRVEAWGDPLARWRHDAAIKVPIGQDVELMLTEGAQLLARAAAQISAPPSASPAEARAARAAGKALALAARQLTDDETPPLDRLAAAMTPQITAALTAWPLRELLTMTPGYPLLVNRQRALYGAWYEFFPRSEGAVVDPNAPAQVQVGDAAHRGRQAGRRRRHGIRRRVPAAGAPDRHDRPQGPEQRPAGRAGRSRLAVGHRLARGRP